MHNVCTDITITNLPEHVTDDQLKEIANSYGDSEHCHSYESKINSERLPIARVKFRRKADALRMLEDIPSLKKRLKESKLSVFPDEYGRERNIILESMTGRNQFDNKTYSSTIFLTEMLAIVKNFLQNNEKKEDGEISSIYSTTTPSVSPYSSIDGRREMKKKEENLNLNNNNSNDLDEEERKRLPYRFQQLLCLENGKDKNEIMKRILFHMVNESDGEVMEMREVNEFENIIQRKLERMKKKCYQTLDWNAKRRDEKISILSKYFEKSLGKIRGETAQSFNQIEKRMMESHIRFLRDGLEEARVWNVQFSSFESFIIFKKVLKNRWNPYQLIEKKPVKNNRVMNFVRRETIGTIKRRILKDLKENEIPIMIRRIKAKTIEQRKKKRAEKMMKNESLNFKNENSIRTNSFCENRSNEIYHRYGNDIRNNYSYKNNRNNYEKDYRHKNNFNKKIQNWNENYNRNKFNHYHSTTNNNNNNKINRSRSYRENDYEENGNLKKFEVKLEVIDQKPKKNLFETINLSDVKIPLKQQRSTNDQGTDVWKNRRKQHRIDSGDNERKKRDDNNKVKKREVDNCWLEDDIPPTKFDEKKERNKRRMSSEYNSQRKHSKDNRKSSKDDFIPPSLNAKQQKLEMESTSIIPPPQPLSSTTITTTTNKEIKVDTTTTTTTTNNMIRLEPIITKDNVIKSEPTTTTTTTTTSIIDKVSGGSGTQKRKIDSSSNHQKKNNCRGETTKRSKLNNLESSRPVKDLFIQEIAKFSYFNNYASSIDGKKPEGYFLNKTEIQIHQFSDDAIKLVEKKLFETLIEEAVEDEMRRRERQLEEERLALLAPKRPRVKKEPKQRKTSKSSVAKRKTIGKKKEQLKLEKTPSTDVSSLVKKEVKLKCVKKEKISDDNKSEKISLKSKEVKKKINKKNKSKISKSLIRSDGREDKKTKKKKRSKSTEILHVANEKKKKKFTKEEFESSKKRHVMIPLQYEPEYVLLSTQCVRKRREMRGEKPGSLNDTNRDFFRIFRNIVIKLFFYALDKYTIGNESAIEEIRKEETKLSRMKSLQKFMDRLTLLIKPINLPDQFMDRFHFCLTHILLDLKAHPYSTIMFSVITGRFDSLYSKSIARNINESNWAMMEQSGEAGITFPSIETVS
ncbi:hypothetical protein SNEBB_003171 [Seison nebaliae]|nr:hypothetical protein SNEBB_003171 [Seison nebaliae]